MSTELINMTDIKEKITEQVKVSFMNLIPEDKFKELVNAELKAFFEDERQFLYTEENRNNYNASWRANLKMTPFRQMVWEEVHKLASAKFEEVKKTTDWAVEMDHVWDEEKQEFIKAYQTEAEAKAETLALGMAKNFFKHLVTTSMQCTTSNMNNDFDARVAEALLRLNLNVNTGY
jgi:hypothetical protein